jgi:hypothetical protein
MAPGTVTLVGGLTDRKPLYEYAGGVAIVVGLLNLALTYARSHAKDKHADERQSPFDYAACLYTMHAALLAHKGLAYTEENRKKLRVTIHRVEGADKVIQLVDYVGGEGGGAGRAFSSRSGLVGRAITSHKPTIMDRNGTYDEYIAALRSEYHMPEDEAKRVATDRYSYMATPIKTGTRVIGVVYLDSSERGFFDASTADVAVTACAAVAQYANFRYRQH